MNNKNIIVPLLELKELCFEVKDVDVTESSFRYLKYPANPHLDNDLETEVVLEVKATGTAEFIAEFNGHKLVAKYSWYTCGEKINDGEYKNLDITDESYSLIECNFSISDEEYDEIEEVYDLTIQINAAGFEDATSDVVSAIGLTHSQFFN